uniref:LamG-like jellyroll fold domain-containing protein n=1 Tax=viral metagenome TaxID=1070528 RepID=A0A6C0JJ62_9ZZZZ
MNTVVIVLGIIIVFLIYILYTYYSNLAVTLSPSASLTTQVPAISNINNPGASRYAYGIWIFINSWDPSVPHTLFARSKNIAVYLDKSSPTLYVKMFMGNSTAGGWSAPLQITDNFPIQKWVHVIASVDNQFLDLYLDGKLVTSHRFLNIDATTNAQVMPMVPSTDSKANPVYVGNPTTFTPAFTDGTNAQTYDAYITKFKRWESGPVDPQTAWNAYMEGNGSSSILGSLGAYGVNLTVLKNNVENSKLVIF